MPRNLSVQLKRKWDKESLEKGKRGRERHKCGEREEERDNHSACWTLTVCEASIIHAAVHMSRAHRQAQQQGRAQIKQRIHGHAHNAPGGTHLDPFLCCSRINREQGYLSAAWFSSRAKSCWNSLCLFFVFFFLTPSLFTRFLLAGLLVPVGSAFSWLISRLFGSLYVSNWAFMPIMLVKSTVAGPQHVSINYGWDFVSLSAGG